MNDNNPVDKPLRGGRYYLTNKDSGSPVGSSNQTKLVSKHSELFDLDNEKVAASQAADQAPAPPQSYPQRNSTIPKSKKLLGSENIEYMKVSFRQFFQVMSSKLNMSKQLREDVIFEDKEKNVSCMFFW